MFLEKRSSELKELMDDPLANRLMLKKTYQSFRIINALLAFWRPIYEKEIRPVLRKDHLNSIADIGCGDGFILNKIGNWAKKDGFKCALTGFEPDFRAMDAVDYPHSTRFISQFLHKHDEQFDIIISNHVLHHLTETEAQLFLEETGEKARIKVIHNDISRSILAYLLFPIIGIWFSIRTFVLIDGLLSIRRSFTKNELRQWLPNNWKLNTSYPFRLLLILSK
jgi:2-polyprenyl-3-methyl-5-hydroxy-6-metoxy-1,4-benzoquinol methylase